MKAALVSIMIKCAMSFYNVPYIYGGNGSNGGIDCSGLINEILKSVGLVTNEDRTAKGLYNLLTKVKEPKASYEPEVGDIVFYGRDVKRISHVAMVIEILKDADKDLIFIIEAGGGNSTTDTLEEAVARGAMVRIRPMLHRSDLVAIVSPFKKGSWFFNI